MFSTITYENEIQDSLEVCVQSTATSIHSRKADESDTFSNIERVRFIYVAACCIRRFKYVTRAFFVIIMKFIFVVRYSK